MLLEFIIILILIAPLIYLLIEHFIQMRKDLKAWEEFLKKEEQEAINEACTLEERIIELNKQIEINELELEKNKIELSKLIKDLNEQIKSLEQLKMLVKENNTQCKKDK